LRPSSTPSSDPRKGRKGVLRRALARLALAGFTTFLAFLGGELFFRHRGGYLLFSARLEADPTRTTESLGAPGPAGERYSLERYIADSGLGAAEAARLRASPPVPEKPPIPAVFQARHEKTGNYGATHLWNDHYARTEPERLRGVCPGLDDLECAYLFHAPWETPYPHYRYPSGVTLSTGLATNRFGYRGPDITIEKPPRTIRIACLGGSTTVCGPGLAHSYPEILEHFLDLWGAAREPPVAFDVINTGRDGIGAADIAAVLRYEVLPLSPDYVIYYEGSNDFDPRSVVHVKDPNVRFRRPPRNLVPRDRAIGSSDGNVLDRLSDHSAVFERIRILKEATLQSGKEAPKPEQQFVLPDGVNEAGPDLRLVRSVLELGKILDALGTIREDMERAGGKMLLATFHWHVYDGLVLDPARHRSLYIYLNRYWWPISYANLRRTVDFQNRVYARWAAENGVDLIDVSGKIPGESDLFADAIHMVDIGVRIQAWIVFRALIPILEQDLDRGRVPAAMVSPAPAEHPYVNPAHARVRLRSGEVRAMPAGFRCEG
jgi:hypothetical protein